MPTVRRGPRAAESLASQSGLAEFLPALLTVPLLVGLTVLLTHCGSEPTPTAGRSTEHRDVAVRVHSVLLDPASDSPIVLLEERQGGRTLPIWIGEAEAQSIAVELGNIAWPRPNSHDLTKRLLVGLDANVERVIVTELRKGTYFAVLVVRAAGKRVEIDSRPSDAIAIALRVQAPVYVRETLFKSASEEPEPDADGGPRVSL